MVFVYFHPWVALLDYSLCNIRRLVFRVSVVMLRGVLVYFHLPEDVNVEN